MICYQYDALTPKEKTEFVGMLIHAVQSDSDLYSMGSAIIDIAKTRGLFDKVIINPTIVGPEHV